MRVDDYDPAWAERFDAELVVLEDVLAPWLSAGVHHIGSTSVPGLAAKPIIDMMAGVESLDAAWAAAPALGELGYVYRVHRPEAHAFHRDEEFHLHLTEPGSDLWRERLAFATRSAKTPAYDASTPTGKQLISARPATRPASGRSCSACSPSTEST